MITIVSGLPRSGTSLMMQMLKDGGMPLLTDKVRKPDESNRKGYFEYEPVKSIQKDNKWMADAEEKAVKVIVQLLQFLPPDYQYKVIFMQRPLVEIVASQNAMLEATGAKGTGLSDSDLMSVYAKQLSRTHKSLAISGHIETLYTSYHDLLKKPDANIARIAEFIDQDLNVEEMVKVVDPEMWHQKSK